LSRLDHTEQLRRLAINDAGFTEHCLRGADAGSAGLDPKTLALARLAALVAIGGSGPSFGAHADAAVSAGATAAEIVDVLVGVVPTVGLPRVVAAAPKVGMALGYDVDGALEDRFGSCSWFTRRAGRSLSPLRPLRPVRRPPASDRSS
jgi:4-carboxymuconolactone decarboxylase